MKAAQSGVTVLGFPPYRAMCCTIKVDIYKSYFLSEAQWGAQLSCWPFHFLNLKMHEWGFSLACLQTRWLIGAHSKSGEQKDVCSCGTKCCKMLLQKSNVLLPLNMIHYQYTAAKYQHKTSRYNINTNIKHPDILLIKDQK